MGSWNLWTQLKIMGVCFNLALVAIFTTVVFAENYVPRNKRAIGIFNVVKFPNDACDSNSASMNGTCYTSEECSSKGGTASGECAEGYGVCCVLSVACAGSTSENGTYFSQASSTDPAKDSTTSQSCTYTICPIATSVNRIRLDLTEFSIAPPLAVADQTGAGAGTQAQAAAMGYCSTDSFTVTGAPVICGTNMGQHLIVDSDGSTCITAAFSYGLSSTTSRAYTIKVTQFESTNDMGGPPGCLQFFTGNSGTVSSFNYAAVTTSTHMANQNYDVCVRAGVDKCAICWVASTAGAATRGSFGVSISGDDAAAQGVMGATCTTDFVTIPNGQAAIAINLLAVGTDRYCGRFLSTAAAATADASVCSAVAPFKLGVTFDGNEVITAEVAAMATLSEASGAAADSASPLGTMGFSLNF